MLPKPLESRLKNILGDTYGDVIHTFANNRKGSFRINLIKTDGGDVFEEFLGKGIQIERFQGIEGVYLFDREYEYAIKGTRVFYDGKIYLQSIASMLPVLVLDPIAGETILDVCAAPGSKTTQIAMIMQNQGKIFAIEQNQIRFDKLIYNCVLQGATCIEGIKMDARRWLDTDMNKREYDRILLDAPCSAEGRISLDNEKTYGFWSLENISKKAELQYGLLELSFAQLKVGGILVYSTCTLAPEENEGVIHQFLSSHKNAKVEGIDIGLSGKDWWKNGLDSFESESYTGFSKEVVRILPSSETEGFFLAKIKKI